MDTHNDSKDQIEQDQVNQLDWWRHYKELLGPLEDTSEKMIPSIVKPLESELKSLLKNLKHGYLLESSMFPVIISTQLIPEHEEALLQVLKAHKRAIGWTIVDINGMSPTLCQHKIRLEEGKNPMVDAQIR